ncbi:MAG: energy-coupling factor ABC transporter permease [Nocardioides sp.]|uniref:energy-coupling factor ABC transporter permease n=1 Tax=Nocardioides sp. TaxID=35761 RepID=UPI003D6AF7D8
MHVPDGFLDAPTSIATGAVAVVAVGVALRGARRELDDKTAPLAGLVAAFVFATQMLNFPVGAGTSGHLMGGALAAVLVGPWTGVLCVSVVLIVQSLLFADGGITALGTNILLMAVTTVVVGWFVSRVLIKVLPKRVGVVAPAAAIGAFISVPAAAAVFTALYAVGGTADISLTTLTTAMLGWHTVIGLGEGVITFLAVGAILSVRPDLVYAARGVIAERDLVIKPKETTGVRSSGETTGARSSGETTGARSSGELARPLAPSEGVTARSAELARPLAPSEGVTERSEETVA